MLISQFALGDTRALGLPLIDETEVVFLARQVDVELMLVGVNLDDVLANEHEDSLATAQRRALPEFQREGSRGCYVIAGERLRDDERQPFTGRHLLQRAVIGELSLRVAARYELH